MSKHIFGQPPLVARHGIVMAICHYQREDGSFSPSRELFACFNLKDTQSFDELADSFGADVQSALLRLDEKHRESVLACLFVFHAYHLILDELVQYATKKASFMASPFNKGEEEEEEEEEEDSLYVGLAEEEAPDAVVGEVEALVATKGSGDWIERLSGFLVEKLGGSESLLDQCLHCDKAKEHAKDMLSFGHTTKCGCTKSGTRRKRTMRSQFITFQQRHYGSGRAKKCVGAVDCLPLGGTGALLLCDTPERKQFAVTLDVYASPESKEDQAKRKRRGKAPAIEWQEETARALTLSSIGAGSFGHVYRALLHIPGQEKALEAALKTVPCHSVHESDLFLKELYAMTKAHHENVLSLYAAKIVPPFYCLATEFAERGTLHDTLHPEKGKLCPHLSRETKAKIALGIARGMNYLSNTLELIHRDLKPLNILVTRDLTPKISDFGESIFSPRSVTLEAGMLPRGSPLYMAPEVYRKDRYGHKCDTFSFGITLWELFSGQFPYAMEQENLEKWEPLVRAVAFEGRRPRDLTPEEASPHTQALMAACVQEDPNERPLWGDIVQILRKEEARTR